MSSAIIRYANTGNDIDFVLSEFLHGSGEHVPSENPWGCVGDCLDWHDAPVHLYHDFDCGGDGGDGAGGDGAGDGDGDGDGDGGDGDGAVQFAWHCSWFSYVQSLSWCLSVPPGEHFVHVLSTHL